MLPSVQAKSLSENDLLRAAYGKAFLLPSG